MRGEDGDGDDNGNNGSHSGPDGQLASSSLALETPSAGGEMPTNDPSSLFPSAIIVGCETY